MNSTQPQSPNQLSPELCGSLLLNNSNKLFQLK
jgi:hypothetical protein